MSTPRCVTAQNFCATCQFASELISDTDLVLTHKVSVVEEIASDENNNGELLEEDERPEGYKIKVIERTFKKEDIITNEIWQQIQRTLQLLHDYGLLGSRDHPSQESVNSIKEPNNQSIIYGKEYNEILDIVSDFVKNNSNYVVENVTQKKWSIIKIEIIEKIQEYLRNYQIDFNRCNDCNASNNCAQCDCHTPACDTCTWFEGGGCGDSCDGGGGCCMYGACADSNSGCHCNSSTGGSTVYYS